MNTVYRRGNEALLERRKTAFLCSRDTPAGVEKAVDEWLDTLRPEVDCIMCGNQSGMERRVFDGLLRRRIPVILMLAEALPDVWSKEAETAMQAGRLLAVTHCDSSVHWASARSARDRNLLMIAWAAEVVAGYCKEGGNLWQQLSSARNVTMLFNAKKPYSVPQIQAENMAGEPQSGSVRQAAALWKQRMWSLNGAITVEINSVGTEQGITICQVRDFVVDGRTNSKIVLNVRELHDFQEALGEVIIQIGNKDLADVKAMTVNTCGGDVTFDFKMLTFEGVLVVTQSVETKFMGLRKRSVFINAMEIRGFYELVSAAVKKAR